MHRDRCFIELIIGANMVIIHTVVWESLVSEDYLFLYKKHIVFDCLGISNFIHLPFSENIDKSIMQIDQTKIHLLQFRLNLLENWYYLKGIHLALKSSLISIFYLKLTFEFNCFSINSRYFICMRKAHIQNPFSTWLLVALKRKGAGWGGGYKLLIIFEGCRYYNLIFFFQMNRMAYCMTINDVGMHTSSCSFDDLESIQVHAVKIHCAHINVNLRLSFRGCLITC